MITSSAEHDESEKAHDHRFDGHMCLNALLHKRWNAWKLGSGQWCVVCNRSIIERLAKDSRVPDRDVSSHRFVRRFRSTPKIFNGTTDEYCCFRSSFIQNKSPNMWTDLIDQSNTRYTKLVMFIVFYSVETISIRLIERQVRWKVRMIGGQSYPNEHLLIDRFDRTFLKEKMVLNFCHALSLYLRTDFIYLASPPDTDSSNKALNQHLFSWFSIVSWNRRIKGVVEHRWSIGTLLCWQRSDHFAQDRLIGSDVDDWFYALWCSRAINTSMSLQIECNDFVQHFLTTIIRSPSRHQCRSFQHLHLCRRLINHKTKSNIDRMQCD